MAEQPDTYGAKLGTVKFPVSCTKAARPLMARGLALVHHMTFKGGYAAFQAAQKRDPDCALAYWGMALTYIHPVWPDSPSKAQFKQARRLLAQAKARGRKTAWEMAYIAAVKAYYVDAEKRTERSRLASYSQAWAKVHKAFPNDREAAAFAALTHLASASFLDNSNRIPKAAGAMLEKLLARHPDHPGAHHYLIHSYDYPGLAKRALFAARRYGKLAPNVPHALHMPTHIFIRLGHWEEAIAWNKRSAAAALKRGAAGAFHYIHALDYVAYAHLQRAQDSKARKILTTVLNLPEPFYAVKSPAFAYALAAIPARYTLERHAWKEAANLTPPVAKLYPWGSRFPAFQAITHFARALGAARSGNVSAAQAAIGKLASLHKLAAKGNPYWANQIEIQLVAAQAWLALAEGKQDAGLRLMQKAAKLEAATGKHPVTPGEVLPAQELLGDMLMQLKRPVEALAAYERTLSRLPHRFNSLYGAGRAAELAGHRPKATIHYKALLKLSAGGNPNRRGLGHARRFLK
jgi:tetratricopeptide (TPR) repeat protein